MSDHRSRRPVAIYALLATDAAAAKLGARGISVTEAQQLPRNTTRPFATGDEPATEVAGFDRDGC
jgi:hypothetical protein